MMSESRNFSYKKGVFGRTLNVNVCSFMVFWRTGFIFNIYWFIIW